MITAICPNPSIDRELHLHNFTLGGTNRVERIVDIAGGKGVNVAMVAKYFGLDAACIGFLPQNDATILIDRLEKLDIAYRFVRYPGAVRINQKVRDLSIGLVTELNSAGPPVEQTHIEAFFDLAGEYAAKSDILVMSGSLPVGAPADFYAQLVQRFGNHAQCVVDAGGAQLEQIAQAGPALIKPNLDEIQDFAQQRLTDERQIAQAARTLCQKGAQRVVVSMGADGAMMVDRTQAYIASALRVPLGSTVGAGDAMVGGMCVALAHGMDTPDILRSGVASSARWIAQNIEPQNYDDLFARVSLTRLQA